MQLPVQVIVPVLVLLTATLWTVIVFWVHPIHDRNDLPWPARRSLVEGIVVVIVWIVTSVVYWQVFRWSMVYKGLGVGVTWAMMTLYWSTALRQRVVDKANRDRGW
ncbi:MAG: hypothetical protein M3R24_23730 [Chloroflexota bacterium]|nr:hypothetical protein [Chloroflexota bacterium]